MFSSSLFVMCFFFCQFDKARSEIRFLKQHEGESVVLPCEIEQRDPAPWGVYLKRTWLNNKDVLFKYTKEDFTVGNSADKSRISVSGDPSFHSLNITISQLKANDTDRYYCEFVVENPSSADEKIPSKTEYFLLVGAGESVLPPPLSSLLRGSSCPLRPAPVASPTTSPCSSCSQTTVLCTAASCFCTVNPIAAPA
uniref:Ig-like domain-containing protein n=1 Tax=Oreochromis niloticus TaxID=8128 RepID=A0A669B392_ORENI